MGTFIDIDFSIEEDELVRSILNAKGKNVEVLAFGIMYSGKLGAVDMDNGTITVIDDEDKAVIDIERIESFSIAV